MNYYLARDGQTYGPYPEESIPTMLEAGQVVPEDLLCPEGGADWLPLNEIPAFAASVPPPIPPPKSAAPGGLRVSAPAPETHAPAPKYVPPTAPDWQPAQPSMAEKAGAVFGKLKFVAYGVGALIVVGVLIAGFIAAQRDAKEIEKLHTLPGWNAFAAGNDKIASEATEAGYGNTPEATQLSARLASVLGMAQKENFAIEKRSSYRGRSKIGRIVSAVNSAKSADTGKFQTFLEMRPDRVIALIHVPDFKLYKGEAREAMRQMCVEIARVAVTSAKKKSETPANPPPLAQPTAATGTLRTAPATRRPTPTNRVTRVAQTNSAARVARPAPPPGPPPDFNLIVALRDKKSYDCVFSAKLSDISVSEGVRPKAASGNVPSHQLLVRWFGMEKPK